MKFLVLLLISPVALGAIFNGDSRYEARLEGSAEVAERARSVPAFVRSSAISKRTDGDYSIVPWTVSRNGFCADEKFSGQVHFANCSASLIGKDLVLTAAHCIDEFGLGCGDYKVVFDFALGENFDIIPKENVYECAEVLYFEFDQTLRADDLAVVRLNRSVLDRDPVAVSTKTPIEGESLSMIGYPLGLPQKADDDGTVLSVDLKNVSFRHDLDTVSCNSGGPIFNSRGSQVGVLVRGTGANTQSREDANCDDWYVAGEKDFAEANTLKHLVKKLKKFGALLD